ncbi:MAG: hypothetical protein HUJ53_08000, partial [Holdemanella sp.]|nr:hypothetical protein [Holdemanella sp.]
TSETETKTETEVEEKKEETVALKETESDEIVVNLYLTQVIGSDINEVYVISSKTGKGKDKNILGDQAPFKGGEIIEIDNAFSYTKDDTLLVF